MQWCFTFWFCVEVWPFLILPLSNINNIINTSKHSNIKQGKYKFTEVFDDSIDPCFFFLVPIYLLYMFDKMALLPHCVILSKRHAVSWKITQIKVHMAALIQRKHQKMAQSQRFSLSLSLSLTRRNTNIQTHAHTENKCVNNIPKAG